MTMIPDHSKQGICPGVCLSPVEARRSRSRR
jgi:hypothetical protein